MVGLPDRATGRGRRLVCRHVERERLTRRQCRCGCLRVVDNDGGMHVYRVDPSGPVIVDGQGVVDLIGVASGHDADLIVVPIERLAPDFFRLSTGVAGEVLQKFVTYGYQVAIVGNIEAHLEASPALRDFVRESNSGRQVWFLPDLAALDVRLSSTS